MPCDASKPGEEKKISPKNVGSSIRKQTHDQMMAHLKQNFPKEYAKIVAALEGAKNKKRQKTDEQVIDSDASSVGEEPTKKKQKASTPNVAESLEQARSAEVKGVDSNAIGDDNDELDTSVNECSL